MDPSINSDPFSDPNSHPPAGPISGSEKTPLPMGGVFGPDRSPRFLERTHIIDRLARTAFAHLPHSTAKEAQAAWRTADRIAADAVAELERIVRVNDLTTTTNGAEA